MGSRQGCAWALSRARRFGSHVEMGHPVSSWHRPDLMFQLRRAKLFMSSKHAMSKQGTSNVTLVQTLAKTKTETSFMWRIRWKDLNFDKNCSTWTKFPGICCASITKLVIRFAYRYAHSFVRYLSQRGKFTFIILLYMKPLL